MTGPVRRRERRLACRRGRRRCVVVVVVVVGRRRVVVVVDGCVVVGGSASSAAASSTTHGAVVVVGAGSRTSMETLSVPCTMDSETSSIPAQWAVQVADSSTTATFVTTRLSSGSSLGSGTPPDSAAPGTSPTCSSNRNVTSDRHVPGVRHRVAEADRGPGRHREIGRGSARVRAVVDHRGHVELHRERSRQLDVHVRRTPARRPRPPSRHLLRPTRRTSRCGSVSSAVAVTDHDEPGSTTVASAGPMSCPMLSPWTSWRDSASDPVLVSVTQ